MSDADELANGLAHRIMVHKKCSFLVLPDGPARNHNASTSRRTRYENTINRRCDVR
jgi:hypothetical protein